MRERRFKTAGRHRAQRSQRGRQRRSLGVMATVSAVGAAGVAVAGAAVIGVAPTLSVSPQLMASLHYLRGTNIGNEPTEQQYRDFIGVVLDGTHTPPPDAPYEKVPYNAGFAPFSHGGFGDLTYNKSVKQGVELLDGQEPASGDIIFGFSQGAFVASEYKKLTPAIPTFWWRTPARPTAGWCSASRAGPSRSWTSRSAGRPRTTAT